MKDKIKKFLEKDYVTIEESAKFLNIPVELIRKAIESGELKAVKVPKKKEK